ncbi:glycerate kinase [Erwinia mallotivora]|uniref:glycerate kinase type-2 family protein n=1 Tax=Erwinia mallotivora TaxID=69222 RepID=UPI0035E9A814
MNQDITPSDILSEMFLAAIESAQPEHTIPTFLPENRQGRLVVLGAGKASAAMARVVEHYWQGELSGLVVTRYGYHVPCEKIEIVEASHPVPDDAGLEAARRILSFAEGLGEDDTVLCLISGGGSSLMPLPLPGISLADKQQINRDLLRSGATISEMNCVRRHLSAIKGGRLATACYPARVITLLISDVPGDNPCDIASGPTVADTTTCHEVLEILHRYQISVPDYVLSMLKDGLAESIKPGDSRLERCETHLISTPMMALEAAADVARQLGIPAYILSDQIEGEARDVGKVPGSMALQVSHHNHPFKKPCILLSGGETTVTLRGNGRGGRNVEFLLSLAVELNGAENIWALAGDTDGVDGQEEIAGALITPDTLIRAVELGINPRASLDNNDGHGFFSALGDSIITGPTLTNVNDFRCIFLR